MPAEVPTPLVPGVVNTIVVQTAVAASTQTAAVAPSASFTPSFTPLPTKTPSVTPSSTATFIFILSTPTRFTPTATPGSGIAGYNCDVTGQSPADGTPFNPGANFDAQWTVANTGSKNWSATNVDVVYVSGSKFYKQSIYDLGTTVKVGDTYTVVVGMVAPKNSGSYTTRWGLRTGKDVFCTMSLTIVVP